VASHDDEQLPVTAGRRALELATAVLGCALVIVALIVIWVARESLDRAVYVSELGATGMPTAKWFQLALLMIVAGGSLVAYAGRGIRSSAPLLRAWRPAVSLWIGCGFFLIASQVTCTAGCPLPVGPSFTWQDFTHTSVAVLAFASACWAMLQTSFARGKRLLGRLSLAAAITVAVVAGAGGIFSLARFQMDVGSWFELVATTVAIGWLVIFGVLTAADLWRSSVSAPLARQDVQHLVGELDQ
jgi:hypothetical protein